MEKAPANIGGGLRFHVWPRARYLIATAFHSIAPVGQRDVPAGSADARSG